MVKVSPMDISPEIRWTVSRFLEEDRVWDDVTSRVLIPAEAEAAAEAVVKQEAVAAGLEAFAAAFLNFHFAAEVELSAADGDRVAPGTVVARVRGRARTLLGAERVALNLLQRLSGVATLTAGFVDAVADLPLPPRIVDTRKTTPGLRRMEKAAVRAGGGHNHRTDLADGILIKDNHLVMVRSVGMDLAAVLAAARAGAHHLLRVSVEVTTPTEAAMAAEAGADVILLDNMTPAQLAEAVRSVDGRAVTEASGGVTLENVRVVAESGVDVISVGALTHSAPAVDISFRFQ